MSKVARTFDLGVNREFLFGVEAELTGVVLPEPERMHCFLDRRLHAVTSDGRSMASASRKLSWPRDSDVRAKRPIWMRSLPGLRKFSISHR